ncbi:hemolysin III family protein [Thermodesulfobacteriota bacterium]
MRNFRDPASGLTHFVGALLAVAGLIALLARGHATDTFLHTISFSVFGVSMFLLYSFSTLYHWLPLRGEKIEFFRKIDHIMIFVFIAASYTPICLITLRGAWGWSILASVWGFTVVGFFMKLFWMNAPRVLYTFTYVLMGCFGFAAIWPLWKRMDPLGLAWLLVGGLFYTTGAVIYAFKRPDPWPDLFGFHEIFHLFILCGSLSHFWMMYHYI